MRVRRPWKEQRGTEAKPSRSLSFMSVLVLALEKLRLEGNDPVTLWVGGGDGRDSTVERLSC